MSFGENIAIKLSALTPAEDLVFEAKFNSWSLFSASSYCTGVKVAAMQAVQLEYLNESNPCSFSFDSGGFSHSFYGNEKQLDCSYSSGHFFVPDENYKSFFQLVQAQGSLFAHIYLSGNAHSRRPAIAFG